MAAVDTRVATTRFTEGHHVKHWANGGETKLGNLVTLCGVHHGLVHEGGYGLTVTDDGLFEANLKITADTGRCQWRGERMDYSQAIEGMQFLDQRADG